MSRIRHRPSIPYEFVFDELAGLEVTTKPMFGCLGVYVGDRIVFILRQKGESVDDDGVWIATTTEHHASLQRLFPSMRSIGVFGPGVTGWQVLPEEADDFESSVREACALVRAGDERIGKIPKSRLPKRPRKRSSK